jgi:3-phenylpropionate/cinnamic acid dioxygenase small subunit
LKDSKHVDEKKKKQHTTIFDFDDVDYDMTRIQKRSSKKSTPFKSEMEPDFEECHQALKNKIQKIETATTSSVFKFNTKDHDESSE